MALELVKIAETAQELAALGAGVIITLQLPEGQLVRAADTLAEEGWKISKGYQGQGLYAKRPDDQIGGAHSGGVSIHLEPPARVRPTSLPPHPEVAKWLAREEERKAA